MSLFLRLLEDADKGAALESALRALAAGEPDPRVFEADPDAFALVPGAPFAYWVSPKLLNLFRTASPFESEGRAAKGGMKTQGDFRFLRLWWESGPGERAKWPPLCKGGSYSTFYYGVPLSTNWEDGGRQTRAYYEHISKDASWGGFGRNEAYYFRPGLTWPRRTQGGLSIRAMPAGCIFADKGPGAFVEGDAPETLLALLALTNSRPFGALVELQMAFGSYEVGVLQRTPVPPLTTEDGRPTTHAQRLATLALRAWSLKRALDTATETSHAFTLPALLQVPGATLSERAAAWAAHCAETADALAAIQAEIDDLCFDLYDYDAADRAAVLASRGGGKGGEDEEEPE